MDVIGYVRVSTAEQADSGAGLAAQREAIDKAVEVRGWRLVAIHEDAGLSGKALKRPGLEAALKAVEAGGAVALVVAKLDRLSRSIVDFTLLMERATRRGWAVVALDVGVDTTTPQGEMVANIMATFAQFERRLIGQRTKDALAVKRAEGVRLGRPPTLPRAVVRRIKRLRRNGKSYRQIADSLNEATVATAQGGRRWYPATVRKILLAGPNDS
jgi:DNA invertase Pin-like site-specific DNA recombinase